METATLRGPVLVGTDFGAAADEALRQGAQLAQDLTAPLLVCHVMPELLSARVLFPQWRGVDREKTEALREAAHAAVRRHLEAIGGAAAGAEIVIDSGTAHAQLLEHASGAGLVVLGPGDVATQVVRHATVPVLVARPAARGPVVGATDFSDPSLPALSTAAAEASRRGVPLHLIHALDLGAFALGAAPVAAVPYLDGASAIAMEGLGHLRELADRQLRQTLEKFAIPGEIHLLEGHATGAVVEYAEHVRAELVVVGTHGRSGLSRIALGSTAAGVIDAAPCSVLVVRLAHR
jgi:nucleotide-binding universal stress UspA family protein